MSASPSARTSTMLFPPTQQLSVATIVLAVTLVYFMWMDVALYINLQQMQPLPSPQEDNNNNSSSASASVTPPARMGPVGSFSPVYPVHVKQLMQGPISHYILNSVGHWMVTYTDVADYLTADAVSAIGLLFALASGRLILSDSLRARQLGVLFWQLRDMMDDLDGWVARKRNVALGFTIQTSSWGYYKDGIFDGIGIIFFLMGLSVHLYKSNQFLASTRNHGHVAYRRLESSPAVMAAAKEDKDPEGECNKTESGNGGKWPTDRLRFFRRASPCIVTVSLFTMQVLLSSVCWNLTLLGYHRLLETYEIARTPAQLLEQNASMKSSTLWMVAYLWRWINPCMLVQYVMVSIIYNRAFEYLTSVQKLGFVPIVMVTMLTKAYYWIMHANLVAAGQQ